MSPFSFLSIFFSVSVFVYFIYLLQRNDLYVSNAQKISLIATAIFFLVLAINPSVINAILATFSFTQGNSRRLIGLLIFSVFFLFLWNSLLQSRLSAVEHTIDRLVRELAKEVYRGDAKNLIEAPICVIIPAYNEEDNIGTVLQQMPTEVCGKAVEALVVVDGGVDNTTQVVKSHNAHVVTHVINRGGGSALHAGFDIALESKVEYIVTLDADGQHLPQEMATLIEPLINNEVDMVNGSRVLGEYESDAVIRAAGVVFFNLLVSLLTLHKVTDCSNSYRAFTYDALNEVRPYLTQRQYHTTEFLIEMLKKGKRVKEVPITIKRRISGESKKGSNMRYAFGFTRAILNTWLR